MAESAAPLAVLLAGVVGLGLLWRLGTWAPASVQTFRRLARRHGIVVREPLAERLALRAPLLRRLQEATDIQRLLLVADRKEAAPAWLLRVLGQSLLATAVLLLLDLLAWVVAGRLAFAPWLAFAVGILLLAIGYVHLRNAALARSRGLELAVNQSLTELAMLTYTRQLPIEVALEDVVARCQTDGQLHSLFDGGRWQELITQEAGPLGFDRGLLASHTAIYEAIAARYGVPAFKVLATTMRRINDKGQVPAEVLTSLAATVAEGELVSMMVKAEQSRARQALPVGLLVLPLLLLIGYPLVVGLAHAFS